MKEFLSTYIELLQNNHDMVGQVHSEFKRQFLEMTVDKLLEQFVLSKYTGLEKPGMYTEYTLKESKNEIKSQMEPISLQMPVHALRSSVFALIPHLS